MYRYNENRWAIGVGSVVAVWVTIGLVASINILKNLVTTGNVQPVTIVLLIVAMVTVAGALSGGQIRRATGFLWLAVGVIGFMLFVISAGLEQHWLVGQSVGVIFIAVVNTYLLFLPDSK